MRHPCHSTEGWRRPIDAGPQVNGRGVGAVPRSVEQEGHEADRQDDERAAETNEQNDALVLLVRKLELRERPEDPHEPRRGQPVEDDGRVRREDPRATDERKRDRDRGQRKREQPEPRVEQRGDDRLERGKRTPTTSSSVNTTPTAAPVAGRAAMH